MNKLFKRAMISVFILLIILYAGASFVLSNRVLQPNSSFDNTLRDINNYWGTTYEEMMALLPPPTSFTVEGSDGIEIAGQYFNVSDSSTCVFVFAHGWARSWPNMLKYYPMVDDCGCNIVMYDHRAHGDSEGKYPTGGIKESKDLIAVSEWIASEKNYSWDQIAWVGSSWGASAVLLAGAEDKDPAFIVADAAFKDWFSAVFERAIKDYGVGIKLIAPGVMQVVNWRAGINYKEASALNTASSIEEPVLLIHSEADPETDSQQSVAISKNLNDKSEFHHTQWGNIHVMDVINNTDEMEDILQHFIQKNDLQNFINQEQLERDTLIAQD